jgi:Bacterial archaeo-eukaryotic release factor family 3
VLQVTADHLSALLAPQEPPCISLYLPTHRRHPEREGDPIRYRNQLRELESSLAQRYPKRDIKALLAPFEAIAHDGDFWARRTEGLAILSAGASFQVFDLQRPVKELLVVADSFHIKPLLRVLQSADRFQVLCLGLHGGRLYEGNRDALDPVEVSAAISAPMQHEPKQSHKDTTHADLLAWLRPIDAAVQQQHSKPSGLPLLLVALPEMQHAFREASRNPLLVETGVAISPEALDIDALRSHAWQQFEPHYVARLGKLVDGFEAARAKGLGANLIDDVAAAAVAGRIGTLLVEADREIPGRLDGATGAVTPADLADPEVDDLIDDIAEAVLRAKGEVVVVPTERMPGECGLAAILRF